MTMKMNMNNEYEKWIWKISTKNECDNESELVNMN